MPCALLEVRLPSLPLGGSPAGGAWLRLARAGAAPAPEGWHPLGAQADQAVHVGVDGVVAETLPIPKLVRLIDSGSAVSGVVAGPDADLLVVARRADGREGFDLRGAAAVRPGAALRALAGGRYAVVDASDAADACPIFDLAEGPRLGAFAARKSDQFFWALDAERVYSSSSQTSAWTRAGAPLWSVSLRTRPSAGIAAFAGDLWLVAASDKGEELVCLDGETGKPTRRARVPPVHALISTGDGLLVGHELGVMLVRARAGRPSTLLKARVDSVQSDGRGFAALSRERQELYVAGSFKSTPVPVTLLPDALGELDLWFVAGGHAALRPATELEEERTAGLLGDERSPRMGRVVCWVPLALPKKTRELSARRWVAELGDAGVRLRASGERVLGSVAEMPELELSEADRRLLAALERQGIVPKTWHAKLEAELLRGETTKLGSLLGALFADAADKGHRLGFWRCERLRQRGGAGLTADLERLLRDEPVRVRQIELSSAETTVVLARGKEQETLELGPSDDPLELARALNRALEAAGAARRLLVLESEPAERAFLLWDPARITSLKRAGIKGVGKPA